MSMSVRWLGPGPTLAMTMKMTRAYGWAALHMHFSVGIVSGRRANEEEGREHGWHGSSSDWQSVPSRSIIQLTRAHSRSRSTIRFRAPRLNRTPE